MKPNTPMKHNHQELPSARKIRRSCERELYRARKKLGQWIPQNLVEQAEEIYYKKVVLSLLYIHENGSNRRLLCDWWDEHVCPEIAELWGVPAEKLARAFRDSFGG